MILAGLPFSPFCRTLSRWCHGTRHDDLAVDDRRAGVDQEGSVGNLPEISDDQIRGWIAFASMRRDLPHLARLRRVLAARVERSTPRWVYGDMVVDIFEIDGEFDVQFVGGGSVRCQSLDVALRTLEAESMVGEDHNVEA